MEYISKEFLANEYIFCEFYVWFVFWEQMHKLCKLTMVDMKKVKWELEGWYRKYAYDGKCIQTHVGENKNAFKWEE